MGNAQQAHILANVLHAESGVKSIMQAIVGSSAPLYEGNACSPVASRTLEQTLVSSSPSGGRTFLVWGREKGRPHSLSQTPPAPASSKLLGGRCRRVLAGRSSCACSRQSCRRRTWCRAGRNDDAARPETKTVSPPLPARDDQVQAWKWRASGEELRAFACVMLLVPFGRGQASK